MNAFARVAALSILSLGLAVSCGGAVQPLPADSPQVTGSDPQAQEQVAPGNPGPAAEQVSPGNPGPSASSPASHPPCSQEIALTCGPGFVDGCLAQATTVHVCVQSSIGASSPPCSQEIALACTEGMVDACGLPDKGATRHVCVVR